MLPLTTALLATPPLTRGVVSFSPGDTSALPGAPQLQALANGIGTFALIAAMIGVIVGAVMWAFGHYSQNYQQAINGRKGVMVSGLAAILIGAAPTLINFFLGFGQTVKP
jgi:type IV secretory pathway VirB2 component (pilin)